VSHPSGAYASHQPSHHQDFYGLSPQTLQQRGKIFLWYQHLNPAQISTKAKPTAPSSTPGASFASCHLRSMPEGRKPSASPVARFRKRNDADAHARTLRRLIPNDTFIVVFAPPPATSSPNSPAAPKNPQAATNRPPQKTPPAV